RPPPRTPLQGGGLAATPSHPAWSVARGQVVAPDVLGPLVVGPEVQLAAVRRPPPLGRGQRRGEGRGPQRRRGVPRPLEPARKPRVGPALRREPGGRGRQRAVGGR